MMDLCRKLEALARQLDSAGTKDQARPHVPLVRTDATTLRQASHVICKLRAEIARLTETIEAQRPRKTG